MSAQTKTQSKASKHHRYTTFDIVNAILLILVALICLYPLIFSLSASFSDPIAVTSGEVRFLPKRLTTESYEAVFKNEAILTSYRNALIITLGGTAVNMIMTILCAYPLSKKRLWGRNVLTAIITFTMFFSGGMIPMFLLIQDLSLYNSWWSLILPGAISTYNMIIMRTFFQTSIPDELEEAATIDGANNWQILMRIVLPLSLPVLAVIMLYYLVGHWNSYFDALLYISDRKKYPLQLILREILVLDEQTLFETSDIDSAVARIRRAETIKYSVVVVSSVPMLVIYPFVQRFFVKGVMIGAIKG